MSKGVQRKKLYKSKTSRVKGLLLQNQYITNEKQCLPPSIDTHYMDYHPFLPENPENPSLSFFKNP